MVGIFSRRRTIRVLTWQDAEVLAAEHMRKRLGFRDAHVSVSGADGGIDVVSKKAIAQVKFHAGKTGAPDIQRLAGVAAGRRVKRLFFSSAGYTPRAVEAANASKVAIFLYDVTGKVTALNKVATKMRAGTAVGATNAKTSGTTREASDDHSDFFQERFDRWSEKLGIPEDQRPSVRFTEKQPNRPRQHTEPRGKGPGSVGSGCAAVLCFYVAFMGLFVAIPGSAGPGEAVGSFLLAGAFLVGGVFLVRRARRLIRSTDSDDS